MMLCLNPMLYYEPAINYNRSSLIDTAIRYYITNQSKSNLAKRVEEGARANTQRDLELAQDWFVLED